VLGRPWEMASTQGPRLLQFMMSLVAILVVFVSLKLCFPVLPTRLRTLAVAVSTRQAQGRQRRGHATAHSTRHNAKSGVSRHQDPRQFAASILRPRRYRMGLLLSNISGCHYASGFVLENGSTDVLGIASLCNQTVGVGHVCKKCNACRDQACRDSIHFCNIFLAMLYPTCGRYRMKLHERIMYSKVATTVDSNASTHSKASRCRMSSSFQSHRIADRSTNASSPNFSIGASTQPLQQQATHNDDIPGVLSAVGSAAFVGIVAVAVIMIAFFTAAAAARKRLCMSL